jgi:hypothetical protein
MYNISDDDHHGNDDDTTNNNKKVTILATIIMKSMQSRPSPVPSPECGSWPCWEMKAPASTRPQVKCRITQCA